MMIPQTWLMIFSYCCYPWIKHDAISSERRETHTRVRARAYTHIHTHTHTKYIHYTRHIYSS